MKWFRTSRAKDREETALLIYRQLAAAARSPRLFTEFGIPDSFDGRFDVLVLHLGLMVARLSIEEDEGRMQADRLSQDLASLYIADMDRTVRELGVGDLSVGKQVKRMSRALYGRALAYHEALVSDEDQSDGQSENNALEAALTRNVWGGDVPETVARKGGVAGLATHTRLIWNAFLALTLDDIAAGHISGLPELG